VLLVEHPATLDFSTVLKNSINYNPQLLVHGEFYLNETKFQIGVVIGILTIISVVAGWYFYSKPDIRWMLEEGLGGWEGDADVPPDPNKPCFTVDWNVSRVTSPVKSGQHSVELYIDGRQDDGTVWIEKEMSVKKDSQIQVNVSFDFYSESESFNVIAGIVGFAATSNPEVEADVTVLGQANEVSDGNITSTRQL